MRYTPHTEEDISKMLSTLEMTEVSDLFSHLPDAVRVADGVIDIEGGLEEEELRRHFDELGEMNTAHKAGQCFAGAGAYDHIIPSAVNALSARSEFVTAYTPYQPEMSQGGLQVIFEYQTMMANLCGLDAANASLYDGATSLCEAALLACRATRRNKIIVDEGILRSYRDTLKTYADNLEIEIISIPLVNGVSNHEGILEKLDKTVAGVLTANPNACGHLSELSELCDAVHGVKGIVVSCVYPMSLGMVKTPGEMGVDIACGEAQCFGLPLSFGGPYLGFMAVRKKLMRNLPGRIVGETVDKQGKRGYVLTLQTREQHIRREKATSNICSNQALCALRAAIYLTLAGQEGLTRAATRCMERSRELRVAIKKIDGVENTFGDEIWFNEFAIRLPVKAKDVINALLEDGILAGVALGDVAEGVEETDLLVATTEKTMSKDIECFVKALETFIKEGK